MMEPVDILFKLQIINLKLLHNLVKVYIFANNVEITCKFKLLTNESTR